MLVSADFLAIYPMFADTAKYPSAVLNHWLSAANSMVNASRWGDLAALGIGLLTAHYLTLYRNRVVAASKGDSSGGIQGQLTSKSVSSVSVGYAASTATIEGAGAFNLTSYGIEYLTLAQLFGAGGMQL